MSIFQVELNLNFTITTKNSTLSCGGGEGARDHAAIPLQKWVREKIATLLRVSGSATELSQKRDSKNFKVFRIQKWCVYLHDRNVPDERCCSNTGDGEVTTRAQHQFLPVVAEYWSLKDLFPRGWTP